MQSKEELRQMLESYKNILNNRMYEYLNYLLELEFSIFKDFISDEEREIIGKLPIYKQIAAYNICQRSLGIIEREGLEIVNKKDFQNKEGFSIITSIEKETIPLFAFSDSKDILKNSNFFLGTINLYKRLYDIERNGTLLEKTKNKLQKLYQEKNPYHNHSSLDEFDSEFGEEVFDGPSLEWMVEHSNEVQYYEKILNNLNNRKYLTEKEKRIIEITSTIHKLLLEDYGFKETDLIDEEKQSLKEIESIQDAKERVYARLEHAMKNYTSPYAIKHKEDETVLTKKLSYVTIKSNIRYII